MTVEVSTWFPELMKKLCSRSQIDMRRGLDFKYPGALIECKYRQNNFLEVRRIREKMP